MKHTPKIVRDWRLHGWRLSKTSVKKQKSVKPEAHPISFAVGGQFTDVVNLEKIEQFASGKNACFERS